MWNREKYGRGVPYGRGWVEGNGRVGLSDRLRRFARPAPMIVTAPGGQPVRWAVERFVREQGWATAASPAQADLLVVCGERGPELTEALEETFAAMPSPRGRVILTTTDVDEALREQRERLADRELQEAGLKIRGPGPEDGDMPGGLMMADVGEDRDGLGLDQLHPVLGPVLTDWPAGLRIDATMQGDVLREVSAHFVDERVPVAATPRVLGLDALADFLRTQMWVQLAREAAELRDAYHAGAEPDADFDAFARRLRRSRRLRAATRGLGVLDGRDAYDRILALVDGATPVDPDVLPGLLTGTELATARIIVHSLTWETPARVGSRG